MKNIIIVAPHCDDEILGCSEILSTPHIEIKIIYTALIEQDRKNEALRLAAFYSSVKEQLFTNTLPSALIDPFFIYYFPDPIYELHPDHRSQGAFGENMARQGYEVVFYSIIMNVPWIHEVKEWQTKEVILNAVYPSQQSLWQTEKKYILFEGRVKWLL